MSESKHCKLHLVAFVKIETFVLGRCLDVFDVENIIYGSSAIVFYLFYVTHKTSPFQIN
jgi:hypothetical protein